MKKEKKNLNKEKGSLSFGQRINDSFKCIGDVLSKVFTNFVTYLIIPVIVLIILQILFVCLNNTGVLQLETMLMFIPTWIFIGLLLLIVLVSFVFFMIAFVKIFMLIGKEISSFRSEVDNKEIENRNK